MRLQDILNEVAKTVSTIDLLSGVPVLKIDKGNLDRQLEIEMGQLRLGVTVGLGQIVHEVPDVGETELCVTVYERPLISRRNEGDPTILDIAEAIAKEVPKGIAELENPFPIGKAKISEVYDASKAPSGPRATAPGGVFCEVTFEIKTGFFGNHTTANKIVENDLLVTYSRKAIAGNWRGTTVVVSGAADIYTQAMEYHRRATQRFRYVNMTQEAAKTCAKAMVESFTRNIKGSLWNATTADAIGLGTFKDESAGEILMADIVSKSNDDGSWDVLVNVNEDDVRLRKVGQSTTVTILFASERIREYDGETE